MEYTYAAMAPYRPSSTLNEPASLVYGENVDYAIRIVQHFLNIFPSGKLFLLVLQNNLWINTVLTHLQVNFLSNIY